ncbi:MAG: hypothetical protein AB7U05_17255 [Mangrovibacterium sp.]
MKTKIFSVKQNTVIEETTVQNCWKNPVVLILSDELLTDERITEISGIKNPRIERRIHQTENGTVSGYSHYVFNK